MDTYLDAEKYAAAWYLEHTHSKLTMHNIALAKKLVLRIRTIGHGQNMPSTIIENSSIAAIFSQTGYSINYQEPIEAARQILQQYLIDSGASLDSVKPIIDCLISNIPPTTQEALLYQDAWNSLVFGDECETYLHLYRSERQLMSGEAVRKSVARGWFYTQMSRIAFYTDFAKAKYQSNLMENIATIEGKVNRSLSKKQEATALFGGITNADPSREVQTFFRTSFDFHTKLVDISDNKARIMISVNSILVSVLISLLTYNFQRITSSTSTMVIVPILIFLIAAVGSLIFAIMASRPSLAPNAEKVTDNLFSFMGFRNYNKVEYQKNMDKLLRDGSAILSSMTSALYALGEILDKKYKYLIISYNVFMIGFIVSVLMFLVIYFL